MCIAVQVQSLDLDGINCKALAAKLKNRNMYALFLPHEEDCTQFYQCGVGGAALQPCGVGTLFSPRHKDCRRPEEAKCVTLEKYLEVKKIALEDFYEELEY